MKVINTKEFASDLIDGIRFSPCEKGKISDDIPDDVGARFLSIPGYIRADKAPEVKTPASTIDKPIEEMTQEEYADLRAPQVVAALRDAPGLADAVEALEGARDKPRSGVLDAIVTARSAQKDDENAGDE